MSFESPAVGDLATAAWADFIAGGYQPWTTYTPSLTAGTTNPTLGSGYAAVGRYAQIGRTVIGQGRIQFGGSGVSAGSGTYYLSFPQPMVGTVGGSGQIQGSCRLSCASGLITDGYLSLNSSTLCEMVYTDTQVNGTAVSAAHNKPGSWTVADRIDFSFQYETI